MDGAAILALVVLGWALFAVIGGLISAHKNRGALEGAGLSVLFGPLGWLIAALLPSKHLPERSRPQSRSLSMDEKLRVRERRVKSPGERLDDDEALQYLND